MKCCRQETRRSVRRGTVELPYRKDSTCCIRLRASGLRRYKPVRRLEAWEQNGGANQGGGGGEVRYRRPGSFRAGIGGFYSLYRYDYFIDAGERTDTWTVFADGRWEPLSWLFVEGRYGLDIADILEHRLSFAAGHEF